MTQTSPEVQTIFPRANRPRSIHAELEILHEEKNDTIEKYTIKKWNEIYQLHILLTKSKPFNEYELAGHRNGLYEHLYRSFPHQLVSKPRFVGVLRNIFGITSTNLSSMDEPSRAMVKHLEAMHFAYETNTNPLVRVKEVGTLQINWRLLLCSLKLLREPMLPESAYLWFGFQLFSSPGILDDSPDLWITRQDLYNIFNFASSSHASSRIINQRIAQADMALPESILNRSRIRYMHFLELQNQTSLQALFEMATPYTSYFIELTSQPTRQYLFQMRKFDKDRSKCKRFLSYYHTKYMRMCWQAWCMEVQNRREARHTCLQAMSRLAMHTRQQAFDLLRQHAMMQVAAIEIQRTTRGMLGRMLVSRIMGTLHAALSIQRLYRDRGNFLKYIKQLKRKSKFAIKIQRAYRGRLGRIVASRRLVEYYQSEMAKLQAQRDALRLSNQINMANRIQRCYRNFKERKEHLIDMADNKEYQRIELEMKQLLDAAERTRQDHHAAVTAYYKKMRDETEASNSRRKHDEQQKAKVIHARREREWADIRVQRKAKKDAEQAAKVSRQQARKVEWEAKIETRAIAKREHLLQVLVQPESKEEDQIKVILQKQINERYQTVRASYKATGIAMGTQEMMDRAQHDILLVEMDLERQRTQEEWQKLEIQIAKEEQDNADRERVQEIENEKDMRGAAATRIQRGTKMHLARKLLRKKIELAFEKVYDVANGQFVYLNTRTKGVCNKPFCLGANDLPTANKWYICPDISGEVYYYNPKTMEQSWSKPMACTFCEVCSDAFAQVYCPNHMKGRFVDPWNLCESCYSNELARDPKLAIDASIFDGALIKE